MRRWLIGLAALAGLAGMTGLLLQPQAQAQQTAQLYVDGVKPPTYYATAVAITMAATATDVMCINGSASKTVYVKAMQLTGVATTATTTDLVIVKRSTANTGGTAVAMTPVPADSADAAATATVQYYTANPAALGTAIGAVHADKYTFTGATGAPSNTVIPYVFADLTSKTVVLRGTAQSLCFNMNGVTPGGAVFSSDISWTEQ